jgi:hypothetical protein
MYVAQLIPLLVEGTFVPGSVTTIAALCDGWFRDEASLVSFVFRSVFHDLIARDWDDEQGVPTPVFDSFVAKILPRLNAALTALPGDSAAALQDLVLAYRDFI